MHRLITLPAGQRLVIPKLPELTSVKNEAIAFAAQS